MKLLIVDNYDSFTYNLVQRVEEAGQKKYLLVKNDQLQALQFDDFDRVLISPGPGIAHEAGQLPDFISRFYQTKKILGICLGFEALVEFFGGKLSQMDDPMHGIQNEGFVVNNNPLFKDVPGSFLMGHYHSWIVAPEDFPGDLEISVKDENGLIMAFRHRQYPLYGLQFHPESFMTPEGKKMIFNWLNYCLT